MEIKKIPSSIINNLNSVGKKTTQIATGCIKKIHADEFICKAKEHNINKDTMVGLAIIGGVAVLAIKAIKGIIHTLKKIKEED